MLFEYGAVVSCGDTCDAVWCHVVLSCRVVIYVILCGATVSCGDTCGSRWYYLAVCFRMS